MRNLILGVFADTQPFKILKETFFSREQRYKRMQSSVFVINGAKSLYGFDDITLCPDWHRGEDGDPGEIWLRRHTLYLGTL